MAFSLLDGLNLIQRNAAKRKAKEKGILRTLSFNNARSSIDFDMKDKDNV